MFELEAPSDSAQDQALPVSVHLPQQLHGDRGACARHESQEGRAPAQSRGRNLPTVPSPGYLSEEELHDKPGDTEEDELQVMSADCNDTMMGQPDS